MTKQEKLSFFEFQQRFTTEQVCASHLFSMKFPNGFICPKCKGTECYKTTTRRLTLYACRVCGQQTTATVGTVMEKPRTDLRKWFWAIYLAAEDKRGLSAVFLAGQIGIKYKTAWLMLYKIRTAMGKRDERYRLAGLLEMDDAFFAAPIEGGKRVRGTDKTTVVIGRSLNPAGHPEYVNLQVIPDVCGETLKTFAETALAPHAEFHFDGYRSYKSLTDTGFQVESMRFDPRENSDHLHWIHTIISNAIAFIAGTPHRLDKKHKPISMNSAIDSTEDSLKEKFSIAFLLPARQHKPLCIMS